MKLQFKIDDYKKEIIYERNKIFSIILFITLIPALINQIKTNTPLLTMVFIDTFVIVPALICFYSYKKKKLALGSMYLTALGSAIGFLGGTIDTGMYAVVFVSVLLISSYQEWKPLVLHCLLTIIGFHFYFKQYIHFEKPEQLGLFYIMYLIMAFGVLLIIRANEKNRKKLVLNEERIENSKSKIEEMLRNKSISEKKLSEFRDKINKNLKLTQHISKEIVYNFSEISKGVEGQTININSINLSLKDIGLIVRDISNSSKTIFKASNETENITQEYSKKTKIMSKESEKVEENIQSTFYLIQELNEKNKDISDILKTLNALSEQTNLLALNASIEAARAGDAGKGFAVVANEVKKLSQDSKYASEKIEIILNEVQGKIVNTVVEVQEGLNIVESNKKTLKETEETFLNLSHKTKEISGYISDNEVVVSSLEYSSEKIIRDMESIAAISEQVNSSIEEILSSIENQNTNIVEILDSFEEK